LQIINWNFNGYSTISNKIEEVVVVSVVIAVVVMVVVEVRVVVSVVVVVVVVVVVLVVIVCMYVFKETSNLTVCLIKRHCMNTYGSGGIPAQLLNSTLDGASNSGRFT
jgi:hypothetical protein